MRRLAPVLLLLALAGCAMSVADAARHGDPTAQNDMGY
jgi:hypothetical protein